MKQDNTQIKEQNTNQERDSDLYGWEEDVKSIWLNYFNKKVFESGLITETEFHSIEKIIHKEHPLKNEKFSGIIK